MFTKEMSQSGDTGKTETPPQRSRSAETESQERQEQGAECTWTALGSYLVKTVITLNFLHGRTRF